MEILQTVKPPVYRQVATGTSIMSGRYGRLPRNRRHWL